MKETDRSRTARAGGYAVQTAGPTERSGGHTAMDRVDLLDLYPRRLMPA